jgi:hypothetical protein
MAFPKQSVKIANGFCRYYSEIGKTLADNIPPPPKHFDHYMSNNNPNSIYFNPTDQNEILNILDKMKAKKSCGHDKLNAHFLKQVKFEISAPPSHSDESINERRNCSRYIKISQGYSNI